MAKRKRSEVIFRQPTPEPKRPVIEGVVVPFLRAVGSGVLVALLAVMVQAWLVGPIDWPLTGVIWALATLVIWGLSTWKGLLWRIEKATGQDFDRDGVIGDPGPRYVLVNAAPPEEREHPVDRAQKRMCAFVEAAGESTAQRDLEAEGFTRDEIQMFRGLLIRGGWATWKTGNKRDGWMLTRPPGVIVAKIQ